MDPGTFDFNTLTLLVAIMGSTMGSTLTLITLMVRQSNRHDDNIKALDTKFTDKIDALDTKFTDKIDALDTKFTNKIDVMGGGVSDARERLARIEGHLMAPGGFRMRGPDPPVFEEPSPENPDPDHRRASGQREAG